MYRHCSAMAHWRHAALPAELLRTRPWPPWGQEAALVAHLPRTPLLSCFLPEIPDRCHLCFPRAALRSADAVAVDSPCSGGPLDKPTPPTAPPHPLLPPHRQNQAGKVRSRRPHPRLFLASTSLRRPISGVPVTSPPSPTNSPSLEFPGTSRRRQPLRRIPFSLPTGRIEPGRSIADGRVLASSPPRPRSAGRIPASPSLPRSRRPLPNGCW